MSKISFLQMTDAASWKGLTTENHLGYIWQQDFQRGARLIEEVQQTNFGIDLEGFLNKKAVEWYETDQDYVWELCSYGVDNIALVEARIDGTAITAASECGKNHTRFELVFAKDWFSAYEKIVGEKNEKYPIRVVSGARVEGTNFVYEVELMSGTATDFVPYEELTAGKLFSREYAPVQRTLSETGREVTYRSHLSMRNAFSQIRIKDKVPGNMKARPMITGLKGKNGKIYKIWQDYRSYMFDRSFREDINRLLMFGTANRSATGDYQQKGVNGYPIIEGSGLREQSETSNTSFYTTFDIEDLAERLLDLSEGRLGMDERMFMMSTGERGMYQFHKAMQDYVQLFTPLRNSDRMYNVTQEGVKMAKGYGGQFVEFSFVNSIQVNVSVMQMYDSRDRNKVSHPDGGVTESYRYDIWDLGTTNGKQNIQLVKTKMAPTIVHKYIPGLRNPFSPDGSITAIGTAEDGWEEHKMYVGGVKVIDPQKTAHFIYNG